MSKASRDKGKRGERLLRDVWKSHGYDEAHRSGQFSAKGESSADIEGIDPRLHIECKVGYRYQTIYDFMEQAKRDAKEGQIPIVNCKMDRKEWLCVMKLDDFIEVWQNQAETVPIIPMELPKDFHIDEPTDGYRYSILDNVELVVRCKDCKHSIINKHDKPLCTCVDRTVKPDDYCSYGERKEDEHKV